ncbi:DUF1836 domain-containing protein [Paenibacillus sp. GSMTC-2017]|uniref:DUF1836 domain-containing protein n=1 Tax=Paenibacillus sp. GSMTC-2017 TaxID=2794350 RepID=UPI0018D864A9|nr:DUF1836 domain-containing protein [Paenibacillus sp. GSMTC-2017]MBH5316942.1 DUF1836 domain-containing protein [Paenibacillus sp. GSMTC-2017]
MESYSLTRQELASLLLALDETNANKAKDILQKAWKKVRVTTFEKNDTERLLSSPVLPPIIEKLMRCSERNGFSLHEIADLGNLLEFSTASATSMQNWVKRDFKSYFNCPLAGKKYSLNQAAMLLIIDDLKSNLDFETIRNLFSILFEPCLKEDKSPAHLVSPLILLSAYATMYEKLDKRTIWGTMKADELEKIIVEEASTIADNILGLTAEQHTALSNILFVAVISIQSAYFQTLARRYCHEIIYMRKG